jgi:hypothetical protein
MQNLKVSVLGSYQYFQLCNLDFFIPIQGFPQESSEIFTLLAFVLDSQNLYMPDSFPR